MVLGIWRMIQRLIGTIIFVAILLGGLEVGLRAFPAELIPTGWLQRFQDDLRTEIAQRLSLPNETQMWQLPRDDGGPPLKLYRPNVHTEQNFSSEERALSRTMARASAIRRVMTTIGRDRSHHHGRLVRALRGRRCRSDLDEPDRPVGRRRPRRSNTQLQTQEPSPRGKAA